MSQTLHEFSQIARQRYGYRGESGQKICHKPQSFGSVVICEGQICVFLRTWAAPPAGNLLTGVLLWFSLGSEPERI